MITDDDKKLIKLVSDNGKFNARKFTKAYLTKIGMYDYVLNRYSDNTSDSLREISYRLLNDIEVIPSCKTCGNPVKFDGHNNRYAQFCSPKCRNNDPEVKAKNAKAVSEYRLKEYADPVKRAEVTAKKIATIKARIGEDNNGSPFSTKSGQQKVKETVMERYGVDNPYKLPKCRENMTKTMRQKAITHWASLGYTISYPDHDHITIHNGCPIHGDITLTLRDFNNRMKAERRDLVPICPQCHPISVYSGMELVIKSFIDELPNPPRYIEHDRNMIKPQELDFYFPEHNLAIEVNGVYYHNEENKPNDYHFNKSNIAMEKGIDILHIWENDIENHQDVVRDILRNRFGVYDKVLDVNELTVVEVPTDHLITSFDIFTLYGYDFRSNFAIELMDENRFPIAFGSFRLDEDGSCQITGLCIEFGVKCDGWRDKIISKARKITGVNEFIYEVSRDMADMRLLEREGFELIGIEDNHYRWIDYNSHVICETVNERFYGDVDDETIEQLKDEGYYRCYDSGLLKYSIKV